MEIEDLNPWPAMLARQKRVEENVQFALAAASAAYAAKLWRKENWETYELTRKSLAWAMMKGRIPYYSPHHCDFNDFVDLFLRDGCDATISDREVFLEPSDPKLTGLIVRAADAMTTESQMLVAKGFRNTECPVLLRS